MFVGTWKSIDDDAVDQVSGRRCGVDVNEDDIVDGAAADRHAFPWEVRMYAKQHSKRHFSRLWPGTLVKPNLVITGRQGMSKGKGAFLVNWSRTRGFVHW